MECIACDNQNMSEQNLRFEGMLKGETLEFIAPAFKCPDCKEVFSTVEHKKIGLVALADAYRKKHGLLTSAQIRGYRESLGMSQDQFAKFLGAGVASIKRWESNTVQDSSNNELIKLKCDPEYAEGNLVAKLTAIPEGDLNGNKHFSLELFAHALSRILPYTHSPLFFFKAMFYVDFLHFKRHGRGITGSRYEALEYGPVPAYYRSILESMKAQRWFRSGAGYSIEIDALVFDQGLFSTDELQTIDDIVLLLRDNDKTFLFDLSHEEDAYKNTAPFSEISYTFAANLKIT